MTYKCPVWFKHSMELARNLQKTDYRTIGYELERRLRHDQHDHFHNDEFHEGCEHCDKEREKYG